MNRLGMALLGFVSAGCMSAGALGWSWQTGHLIVTCTDKETGGPITNATVTVSTLNRLGLNAGVHESHYTRTSAMTDSNGVADVEFRFIHPDFEWEISTPTHYSGAVGIPRECFRPVIDPSDYEDIDESTADGAGKIQQVTALHASGDVTSLLQLFEPKNVTYTNTTIRRSLSLMPEHNPQPMYVYTSSIFRDAIALPYHAGIVTDGVELYEYPDVDVDLERCGLLPPYGKSDKYSSPGVISDFKLVRNETVVTNGIRRFSGYIQFAPGCGAYKRLRSDDVSFSTAYTAETNETYLSRIDFSTDWNDASNIVISTTPLLLDDEYMVMRTRVAYNEFGAVTNCHYSKAMGLVETSDKLLFKQIVFNPRPNDPNLEPGENLAPRH